MGAGKVRLKLALLSQARITASDLSRADKLADWGRSTRTLIFDFSASPCSRAATSFSYKMDEINDDSAQPIFRAAKRRRVWRKRTSDEEEEETGSASVVQEPTLQSPNGMRDDGENGTGQERQSAEDVAALALLRRQRLAKVRRPGIGFSKNTNVTSQEEQVVEVPEKSGTTAIAQAQGRFVPQMGMMTQETIENCERHM